MLPMSKEKLRNYVYNNKLVRRGKSDERRKHFEREITTRSETGI